MPSSIPVPFSTLQPPPRGTSVRANRPRFSQHHTTHARGHPDEQPPLRGTSHWSRPVQVDVRVEPFFRAGNSSMAGAGLEPWRELFRGRDIYDVIGKAILVAATDSPKEFRRRRDSIVEQIYTAPAIPTLQGRSTGEVSGSVPQVSEKGSKVASCTVGPQEEPEDKNDEDGITDQDGNAHGGNANAFSEIEIDWLQTLADEMDAETQEIDEVLRIKEILLNHHEQSTAILFESLRRLQLMQLTVDKMKSTGIGSAVAALGKHKLHKIRMLVREIIRGWKAVVDDWIAATKATMDDKSLDVSNPLAAEDEGGLATPPMDVGALFLVSQATAIQNVSEFLHGTDGDGTKIDDVIIGMDKGGVCGSNNSYDGAKPSNNLPARQRTPSRNTNLPPKLLNAAGNSLLRQQGRQSDLPTRLAKTLEKKPCEENQGAATVTRNPPIVGAAGDLPSGQVMIKKTGVPTQLSGEPKLGTGKRKVQLENMNLDETKRKLHGAYQEAENAKKKRAIQVVGLCDIAKSKDICRKTLTMATSMNPMDRATPLTKSMNRISSPPSTKQKSHIIRSCEHDRCK